MNTAGGAEPKPRTFIRPYSRKPHKVARRQSYKQAKAEFWKESTAAQFGIDVSAVTPEDMAQLRCQCQGCRRLAQDLHHKAGRNGANLTDKTKFMAVCRIHHDHIHANPAIARERGYLLPH